jgi:uncharacterized protein with gpF-like domain
MTPKRKNQVKKYRQQLERQNTLNFRAISKVFRDFGEDVETDLTKIKIMSKINFKELERRLRKVLKERGSLTIGRVSDFVNTLFGMGLDNRAIETVKNDSITEYHKNVDNLIKNITDTTKKQISILVADSQAAGKNINVIAKEINDKFIEISKGRAKTIARTETSKAVNITTNNSAIEAKMKFKIWIHTGAGATDRPYHASVLDGQKIKVGEDFNVNGHKGAYPHDPRLPASESINCNCICIYE